MSAAAQGYLILAGSLVIAAGLGWWWLRTHMLGICLWCKGTGRNRFSTRKRWGPCRHCGGSGKRERKI